MEKLTKKNEIKQTNESLQERARYEMHAQNDDWHKIVEYGAFPTLRIPTKDGKVYYSTEIKQNGEIIFKLPFKVSKGLSFITDGMIDWECAKGQGIE